MSARYWNEYTTTSNFHVDWSIFLSILSTYKTLHILGSYKFRIIMSYCWVNPFIFMKCSSLSLVTLLDSKFSLADVYIYTTAFFWLVFAWYVFFHPLLSNYLYLFLFWKTVFSWVLFLIQASHLCFFKVEC